VLCPSSIDPFLGTPSPSNSSTPHFTKAPSTYTIGKDTYGHKHSPKDMLFASMRVLLVQKDQSFCEGLLLLLGHPKVNYGIKGGID